ncbi:transposase [Trichococcus shcherbakoviae]|uniref:transposase n=1 Tax=Trichococcus shcherbakoviae TaxID=2094020 RepID=UPI0013571A62
MTREANEFLIRHEYIIINYSNNISAKTVFRTYCKCGPMENFIIEAKNGFYLDKTDSFSFLEIRARMMGCLLLTRWLSLCIHFVLQADCPTYRWTQSDCTSLRSQTN